MPEEEHVEAECQIGKAPMAGYYCAGWLCCLATVDTSSWTVCNDLPKAESHGLHTKYLEFRLRTLRCQVQIRLG